MTTKRKAPDLLSETLAGSETEQGHKERLRNYSSAKKHSNAVASFILSEKPRLRNEGDALLSCSSWLVFRHFYVAHQYRLIVGCTCKKHLLCAMCALRRSARTVREYEAKLRQVMTDNPDLVPVLLTLTIKNGPDLDERTSHLDSAFSRMIRNRSNALTGGRHTTVFRLIHGGAGAFEFKRGAFSGLWHPHIHMLALVPSGFDQLDMEWNLSQEWRELTGDSHNVDVTPIDMSSDESRFKAICEVFRYALKFGEMEIEDQVHAYEVLKGRRLVRSFGSLRGVKVSEELHDSVEEALQLQPYIDLVYHYSKDKGYFLHEVTDTGDTLTAPSRPKSTEGELNASRFSSKLAVHLADPRRPGHQISVDQEFMDQWIESTTGEYETFINATSETECLGAALTLDAITDRLHQVRTGIECHLIEQSAPISPRGSGGECPQGTPPQ
jgi:hypothetical protein